jgi:MFS superfamily sulfate permease-like transporter
LLFHDADLQSFVVLQDLVAFHVSCQELAVAALGVVVLTSLTQIVLKLLPGVAACIAVVMNLTLMILIQSVTAGVAVMMSLTLMILKLLIPGVTAGVVMVASLIQMLLKLLICAYQALLHELKSKSGQD